jgi:hypothetical protein
MTISEIWRAYRALQRENEELKRENERLELARLLATEAALAASRRPT